VQLPELCFELLKLLASNPLEHLIVFGSRARRVSNHANRSRHDRYPSSLTSSRRRTLVQRTCHVRCGCGSVRHLAFSGGGLGCTPAERSAAAPEVAGLGGRGTPGGAHTRGIVTGRDDREQTAVPAAFCGFSGSSPGSRAARLAMREHEGDDDGDVPAHHSAALIARGARPRLARPSSDVRVDTLGFGRPQTTANSTASSGSSRYGTRNAGNAPLSVVKGSRDAARLRVGREAPARASPGSAGRLERALDQATEALAEACGSVRGLRDSVSEPTISRRRSRASHRS
jgi:hypothetical protein